MSYFLRRLLLIFPTFIGITLLCFSLTRVLPGGPVEQQMMAIRGMGGGEAGGGGAQAPAAIHEDYRQQLESYYGFDQPFFKAYYHWLVPMRMGMQAPSYKYSDKTAWQIIRERFPISLWFGLSGFFLSYLICIPLGISKALRHQTPFDAVSSLLIFSGYALPAFALGMLLKMLFSGTVDHFWDVLPLGGFESDSYATLTFWQQWLDRLHHMLLPVTCYVAGSFAMLTLMHIMT